MTERALERENVRFLGTGGISAENRCRGFRPAFRDAQTNIVYPSCFADGRRAPCHLLDGLPDEVVVARDAAGRVAAVKASVTSGFVCDGRFYTREEAAQQLRQESA
ncbi:hypothetical protein [Aromatoleum buckelii]|uniref:Uncharacterized protein n=1 Tax=Aromatoleum buckelii TaxID=200254 RepID=A0ABX1N360_9RHOO|nr:hypothetical protein [Aromatoleum buckelii]